MMPAPTAKADVAIVGGGPGGAAAAIICARSGLRVILLESAVFPRHRPGETLHPGVSTLLDQLGVREKVDRAGFLRSPGHVLEHRGSREFVPYGGDEQGPWLGYHAWRPEFDRILLDTARIHGVEVWQPSRAKSVIESGGRIAGIETTRGPIGCRFLIDASGAAQWLRKKIRARNRWLSADAAVKYGYNRGCRSDLERPVFRIFDSGWIWATQVKPGIVAWTSFTIPGEAGERDDLLAGTVPIGRERGAPATWRFLPECAGPGFFVVGDAAASLDPACGKGILRAIACGIHAADLIVRSDAEHGAAQIYRSWLHGWIEDDAARLLGLYRHRAPLLARAIAGA